MKRESKLWTSLILGFVLSLMITVTGVTVFAFSESDNNFDLSFSQNISREIFGDIEIESSQYLYDLNEEPNYICVNFVDGGYAIYFRNTMELMEYSPIEELPYKIEEERKYYAGPSNYYYKKNNTFIDAEVCDLDFLDGSAEYLEQNVINLSNEKSSTAPSVGSSLIPANPPGTIGTNYIPNAQYFTINPTHGLNVSNTCGSVAAQLLLGYNNFYNDRRIIAPEHLNGGWNNATGNDNVNDSANYTTPSENPNVCSNPKSITSKIAGTNNNFFNYIVGNIQPSGNGSDIGDVQGGLNRILKQRLADDAFEVNIKDKLLSPIRSEFIKSEIDEGRPLIIGTSERLGGHDHWVVGYGYQDYTYPVGHSSAGETYSGYIVHYGWTGEYMVWINESWCEIKSRTRFEY